MDKIPSFELRDKNRVRHSVRPTNLLTLEQQCDAIPSDVREMITYYDYSTNWGKPERFDQHAYILNELIAYERDCSPSIRELYTKSPAQLTIRDIIHWAAAYVNDATGEHTDEPRLKRTDISEVISLKDKPSTACGLYNPVFVTVATEIMRNYAPHLQEQFIFLEANGASFSVDLFEPNHNYPLVIAYNKEEDCVQFSALDPYHNRENNPNKTDVTSTRPIDGLRRLHMILYERSFSNRFKISITEALHTENIDIEYRVATCRMLLAEYRDGLHYEYSLETGYQAAMRYYNNLLHAYKLAIENGLPHEEKDIELVQAQARLRLERVQFVGYQERKHLVESTTRRLLDDLLAVNNLTSVALFQIISLFQDIQSIPNLRLYVTNELLTNITTTYRDSPSPSTEFPFLANNIQKLHTIAERTKLTATSTEYAQFITEIEAIAQGKLHDLLI